MLPFLKKKQEASVSVPADVEIREPDQEEEYDGLQSAAEDILSAIKSNSAKGLAEAFRAAFQLCENQPHEEHGE